MRIKTPDSDGYLRANMNGWQIESERFNDAIMIRNNNMIVFVKFEWNVTKKEYEATVETVFPDHLNININGNLEIKSHKSDCDLWNWRTVKGNLCKGDTPVNMKIPEHLCISEEDLSLKDVAKQEIEKLKMSFREGL